MSAPGKTATHRSKHLEEGIFELKTYPGAGFCLVKNCRKHSVNGKLGLCHRHHQVRFRQKCRRPSAYATLRDHCKARRIEFSLSYEYFCGLCDAVGYFEMTGLEGSSATLDRVDPSIGYRPGNVRVVTRVENSEKSNKERFLPEHVQDMLRRKRERLQAKVEEIDRRMNPENYEDEDACPF